MASKPQNHGIINIDFFYGRQYFVIWKKKNILVYHGHKTAVENDLPASITLPGKAKILK